MEVLALASRSQLVVAIIRWPSVASLGILEVQASSVSPCVPVDTRVGSEGPTPEALFADEEAVGVVEVDGVVEAAGAAAAAGGGEAAGGAADPLAPVAPPFISAQPMVKVARPKEA
jgi:hypothetical protein